jgi:hypothetical protein
MSACENCGVTTHASGTFEVKLSPQGTEDKGDGATLSRMSIDKQFQAISKRPAGELVGFTGKMMINIADGKHFYEFEYPVGEGH